jgi:hypothetical protein
MAPTTAWAPLRYREDLLRRDCVAGAMGWAPVTIQNISDRPGTCAGCRLAGMGNEEITMRRSRALAGWRRLP